MTWQWPRQLRECGQLLSVMYTSDKWQRTGDYQDYKHVAEDQQLIFVRDGFIRDEDGDPLELVGPSAPVNGPMPTAIAVLAPILGIQVKLYASSGNGYRLPSGDNTLYQINIPKAKLGAAVHPGTDEKFLVIFTDDEVLAIITGRSLDVLHDGISG